MTCLGVRRETVLLVLALFAVKATQNPADIAVGGNVPISIKTEGQVTALLLLLTSGGQFNVSVPDTCQQPKESASTARNCLEVQEHGHNVSGLYNIRPYDCCPDRIVRAYCDMDTDGGGWTVIQRRDKFDVQEEFYRTWLDYVNGFGNLEKEFWLGLEHIHALTNQTNFEARVDLGDFEGGTRFAKYESIDVGDRKSYYKLVLGTYSGDAGNSLDHHTDRKFSTYDKDNDNHSSNCALTYKGAWWYGSCHNSNLNGEYLEGVTGQAAQGIIWQAWRGDGYSLKKSEIKIRPKKSTGH